MFSLYQKSICSAVFYPYTMRPFQIEAPNFNSVRSRSYKRTRSAFGGSTPMASQLERKSDTNGPIISTIDFVDTKRINS